MPPPSSSTSRMNNEFGSSSYSCMPYPMQPSTNSELRASALPYTYPESGSEQFDSMGPNEYYYDPACYYIPYIPEHSVSSSHANTSDYSGDWYHNPPPSHSQQWYPASEAPSSSYYPPVTSDFIPYYYSSPFVHDDPVSSTTCITSWEDWSLASTSHSPNSDNTSSLYCPIQSDSSNFYTWCQSEHLQEKPLEDKFNTAPSKHEHPEHSVEQTAGKSMEGMMGFEQVYSSWKDKVSTIIGMEHSPTVPTCLSFEDISTISFQKDFESNAYGPPSGQLQRSVELADPKSGQTAPCPADAQAYISASNPISLGMDSLLSDFHESGNPTVLSPPLFMEIPSANLHESNCNAQVSKCINFPFLNMENTGTKNSTVEGSCTNYQESSAVCTSSRAKKAVHYPASTNPFSHVLGCDTNPLSFSTSRYCNDPSKAMNQSASLASTVNGMLSDDISYFREMVHNSQRMESSKEANLLKGKDDPLLIPKSIELGLCYSFQDTAANHSQFSPVVDILSSDYHPPTPKRLFPLPSRKSTPVVSNAQPVQCLTGPTNLGSNQLLHSPLMNFAVSEPEFLKEPTECQKDCFLLPTFSFNETVAVECSQGSTGTDAGSFSESTMLTNDASAFLETAFVGCRKDCHKLVQTMHNLSVTLLASSSVCSDNVRDPDIQALQSVICNLSEYLVKKMELPISNDGDASKPEMSSVIGNLGSTQKNESRSKHPKSAEAKKEKDDSKPDAEQGTHTGKPEVNPRQSEQIAKPPEAPKDYIHVTARRGQATDSHSLAERVRREKISERMKLLQDLVPGCNKVTGKAVMVDEIINYVQSLQCQVEFLSMKLEAVNPRLDFNMEGFLSKDVCKSHRCCCKMEDVDFSRKESTKVAARSASGGKEFAVGKTSTPQIPASVWSHMADSVEKGSTSMKFSQSGQAKCSEMLHGEPQNLFENLKQEFRSELKERDERIRLYKSLWSDAEAAVDSMLFEMKLVKMEFEMEKLKKRNRGTLEFGNIESETFANKEAVISGNCLPVNLDIKGNDLDYTAIKNVKEKNGLADLNLNPVMDNTLETVANGIIQRHGGVLLSKNKSDHTAVQILKEKNVLADLNLIPLMDNALETDENEIIQRHRGMLLAKSKSDHTAVQTLKDLPNGLADLNLIPVMDNALEVDANTIIQNHGGLHISNSKSVHTAVQTLKEKNGLADLNLDPVMDNALETDTNGIIQKHGGMHLSKNTSYHTAIQTLKEESWLDDLTLNPVLDDALGTDANGIIQKHEGMHFSKNKSDHTAIQSLKEKIWLADLNLNPVMDNALETDSNEIIQKHIGMLFSKNKSDHIAIHSLKRKNGLADLNLSPDMDNTLETDEDEIIQKNEVMLHSVDKSQGAAVLNSSLVISDQNTWRPHTRKDTEQMEGILTELGILEEYGSSFDLKKLDVSTPQVNDFLGKKPIDESDPLSHMLDMGFRIDSIEGQWKYNDEISLLDPEDNSQLKKHDKPLPCALGSVKIEFDYADGYDNLFGKQRTACTLQECESGSFSSEGNQLRSSKSAGPCDFSSSIFMGTSISNTWKPSDHEVKYLLPLVRNGSISSSLANTFHIESEKCVHVEDPSEVLPSKYADIEILVSKESNFFMDTLGQTRNIFLDKVSKVESPNEYEFVYRQNELENVIAVPTSGETSSESESSWEQVNEEDF